MVHVRDWLEKEKRLKAYYKAKEDVEKPYREEFKRKMREDEEFRKKAKDDGYPMDGDE